MLRMTSIIIINTYIKTTKDFFDSQATEAFNVQLCLSPLNESDPPRVSTRYQNLQ